MSKIPPTATIRLAQILQTEPEDSLTRLIAQTIVQHMSDISSLSTNDIAHLCNISKTTLIRFFRHLGFESFSEFKYALIYNDPDVHHKYSLSLGDATHFASDYFNRINENINWMKNCLDLNLLQNMAQELSRRKHIYLLGNAQSGNSANNLMFGLLQMGKFCQVATIHWDHMQIISHLKPDSMVIVISNYGSFFEMFVTPNCFKNKPENTLVYLMTCNSTLTKPEGIDYILLCNEDEGLAGGNLSIDITIGLLLQFYRSLATI